MNEAQRQATTSSSVESGMVFMPCGESEEVPGARPLLYGVRPQEDLAIFQEAATGPRGGVAGPTVSAGQATKNDDSSKSASQGGISSVSGNQSGLGQPGEGSRAPSRQGPLGESCPAGGRGEAEGRPVAGNKWARKAIEHQLKPMLLFSARDLEGGVCTIVPGTGGHPSRVSDVAGCQTSDVHDPPEDCMLFFTTLLAPVLLSNNTWM